MKKVYVVSYAGYKPSVAFEDEEKAKAVRDMCGGDVEEVPLLDAAPSVADMLGAIAALTEDIDGEDDAESEGDGDGL